MKNKYMIFVPIIYWALNFHILLLLLYYTHIDLRTCPIVAMKGHHAMKGSNQPLSCMCSNLEVEQALLIWSSNDHVGFFLGMCNNFEANWIRLRKQTSLARIFRTPTFLWGAIFAYDLLSFQEI